MTKRIRSHSGRICMLHGVKPRVATNRPTEVLKWCSHDPQSIISKLIATKSSEYYKQTSPTDICLAPSPDNPDHCETDTMASDNPLLNDPFTQISEDSRLLIVRRNNFLESVSLSEAETNRSDLELRALGWMKDLVSAFPRHSTNPN
jgi:hypothetical protein